MARLALPAVRIAGVASALPAATRSWEDDALLFGRDEMEKTARTTGIRRRHVAPPGLCTSDLCHEAAGRLLTALGWARDTVDGLIFVSQSPDYELPSTACILQTRLGLGDGCAAFDVALGCSGFVYGLWLGAQIVSPGAIKRALVLCGDISTRRQAPLDKAVTPLFGDAGTALALEWSADAQPMHFELGTDGTGAEAIIIPASGFRRPRSVETKRLKPCPDGIERADEHIHLNGPDVFNFTIKRVPPLVERVIAASGVPKEAHDHIVFHQANEFMLRHLAKRLKLAPEQFVLAMAEVGNTSSASIPLALTTALGPSLTGGTRRVLMAGFGVGLSWAAVSCEMGPMVVLEPALVGAAPGLAAAE